MKVLKNKRKDYTVSLEIRTDVDNMPTAMDKAFKNVVKNVKKFKDLDKGKYLVVFSKSITEKTS